MLHPQFGNPRLASQAPIRVAKPSYTTRTLCAIGTNFVKLGIDKIKLVGKISVMKIRCSYILISIVFLLFVSCIKKGKTNVETEPYADNLENNEQITEETVKKNVEINFNVINMENNIQITIGDIIFIVPNDYSIGFFYGDKYEYNQIMKNNTDKFLHIMVFSKNTYFDGADSSYDSENIPLLQNYIDGISDDISRFHGQYRRNIYNNIKVAERLLLCEHEIINIIFNRQICFIYNDIVYIFTIYIYNIDIKFIDEMGDYFEIKTGWFSNKDPYGWISEKLDELYIEYKNYNKLPPIIERLFFETDIIFNNIIIS
jgi:hypothetical protein